MRHPPHGGVVEEDRLDQRLGQIDEVVVPPNMGQLVGQDRLKLRGGHSSDDADREQDYRLEVARHDRHLHHSRLQHADGLCDAEPLSGRREGGLHGLGDWRDSAGS